MLVSRLANGAPEVFASIQGEGVTVGVPSVFVRLAECNLKCTWCFAPETPVLMADWSWQRIGDLRPGAEVIGIERPNDRGEHVKLARGAVTLISMRCAPTVIVNNSVRCTPDHEFWLTGRNAANRAGAAHSGWREVSRAVGLTVLFTTEPGSRAEKDYQRGWLSGMADHPGATRTIESVVPTDKLEEVITLSTTLGSFVAAGYVVKNCDTKYTWQWDHFDKHEETVEIAAGTLLESIKALAGAKIRNIVFTGGEPLLQQDSLLELAQDLRADGFRIEVETNGTIEPTPELARHIDQWNVSPKLDSSGNKRSARLRPVPLSWFAAAPNAFFKFVVAEPRDLPEITALIERYGVPRERVLVMPEGTSPDAVSKQAGWLVEECQKAGLRFGTRLHVLLWSAERGR